jgi:hypothetical protein
LNTFTVKFDAIKATICVAILTASAEALAGPSLGSGGGSMFSAFRTWMQNWIDFVAGPFGYMVTIFSIILAFVIWSVTPKEGILAPVLRVVVSGIAIANVSIIAASFNGNTISI